MIRVESKPEPMGFDAKVRQRGQAFLAKCKNPTNQDFKKHGYWKSSADELHAAYSGICAYSCFYMMRGTTDHFLPKSTHPYEAYEWDNFRLCADRINSHKGDSRDVIDPFIVQPGWFILDVPSCLIRPGQGLTAVLGLKVESTINVLQLNKDDNLVQERCNLMVDFAAGDVTLAYLSRRYPFLAAEIERQGLQATAATIFKGRTRPV